MADEAKEGMSLEIARLRAELEQMKRRCAISEASNAFMNARLVKPKCEVGHGLHVIDHLGQGGYGEVFLCERTGRKGVKRQYAVKRIVVDDENEWMLREAEIHANLKHPNIVECVDSWIEPYFKKRRLYLQLEYCANDTLRAAIEKNIFKNRKNHRLIPRCFNDCLKGMAFLHSQKILHRDISPENIVFSNDGTAKLIDFGSAISFPGDWVSLTPGHGKTLYRPAKRLSPLQADIWSLGIVFFEVACDLFEKSRNRDGQPRLIAFAENPLQFHRTREHSNLGSLIFTMTSRPETANQLLDYNRFPALKDFQPYRNSKSDLIEILSWNKCNLLDRITWTHDFDGDVQPQDELLSKPRKNKQEIAKTIASIMSLMDTLAVQFRENAEFLEDLINARASYDFLLFRLKMSPFASHDAIVSSYLALIRTHFYRHPVFNSHRLKELVGFAKLFGNAQLRLKHLENIRNELLAIPSIDENHVKWMQILTILIGTNRAKLSRGHLKCLEVWSGTKCDQNAYYYIKEEFRNDFKPLSSQLKRGMKNSVTLTEKKIFSRFAIDIAKAKITKQSSYNLYDLLLIAWENEREFQRLCRKETDDLDKDEYMLGLFRDATMEQNMNPSTARAFITLISQLTNAKRRFAELHWLQREINVARSSFRDADIDEWKKVESHFKGRLFFERMEMARLNKKYEESLRVWLSNEEWSLDKEEDKTRLEACVRPLRLQTVSSRDVFYDDKWTLLPFKGQSLAPSKPEEAISFSRLAIFVVKKLLNYNTSFRKRPHKLLDVAWENELELRSHDVGMYTNQEKDEFDVQVLKETLSFNTWAYHRTDGLVWAIRKLDNETRINQLVWLQNHVVLRHSEFVTDKEFTQILHAVRGAFSYEAMLNANNEKKFLKCLGVWLADNEWSLSFLGEEQKLKMLRCMRPVNKQLSGEDLAALPRSLVTDYSKSAIEVVKKFFKCADAFTRPFHSEKLFALAWENFLNASQAEFCSRDGEENFYLELLKEATPNENWDWRRIDSLTKVIGQMKSATRRAEAFRWMRDQLDRHRENFEGHQFESASDHLNDITEQIRRLDPNDEWTCTQPASRPTGGI